MRLFIAFPLEKTVKEQLASLVDSLAQKGGPVKWVEPHNLHLTVRFLGETSDSKISGLNQMLDAVAPRFQPVNAVIHELGAFPNVHRPRIIWLGLQGPVDRLAAVADEVEKRVQTLGFPAEPKSFKAHLTLGRVKEGQRIGNLLDHLRVFSFEAIPVHIDRLTLYQSTLTPKGPIYDVIHESLLGPTKP